MTDHQPDRQNGDGAERVCLDQTYCTAPNCSCPVHDAAEGADPSFGLPKSHFAKYKTSAELDAENSAPPKPAPDAMRKAAQRVITAYISSERATPTAIENAIFNLRDALCSAPVPPADGANIIDSVRVLGPPDPSDEEFEHGWAACNEAVVELLTDLGFPSPSPAVAAEPVAHEDDDGWTEILYPDQATPPVRGDREAIARATREQAENVYNDIDDDTAWEAMHKVYFDAILSLPVKQD